MDGAWGGEWERGGVTQGGCGERKVGLVSPVNGCLVTCDSVIAGLAWVWDYLKMVQGMRLGWWEEERV